MTAHESQYFDWLPWTNGELDMVPKERNRGMAGFLKRGRTTLDLFGALIPAGKNIMKNSKFLNLAVSLLMKS